MSTVVQRVGREPNAIAGLITAGVNLAVLFGWALTADQVAGINVFFGAVFVAIRFLTTPANEVVAQLHPGETQPVAGPAAESAPGAIPQGTPVELVTGMLPPPKD